MTNLHTYREEKKAEYRNLLFSFTLESAEAFLDSYADGLIAAIREEVLAVVEENRLHYRKEADFMLSGSNTLLAYDMDSRYVAAKHMLEAIKERFSTLTTTNE